MDKEKLIKEAIKVRENAFCPISKFKVGASILTASGDTFTGCNVEFDNFSNTLHAEEVAIGAMIASGGSKPIAIAVCTTTKDFPCGMCRQSLFEIGGKGLIVIACGLSGYEQKTMGELLPDGFKL